LGQIWPQRIAGDYMLACVSYIEMQSFGMEASANRTDSIKNPLWKRRFRALLTGFNEFDNPVVVVVKLKNDDNARKISL
jgi:hypothetical protein